MKFYTILSYPVSVERAHYGWVQRKFLILGIPDGRQGSFGSICCKYSIERIPKCLLSKGLTLHPSPPLTEGRERPPPLPLCCRRPRLHPPLQKKVLPRHCVSGNALFTSSYIFILKWELLRITTGSWREVDVRSLKQWCAGGYKQGALSCLRKIAPPKY